MIVNKCNCGEKPSIVKKNKSTKISCCGKEVAEESYEEAVEHWNRISHMVRCTEDVCKLCKYRSVMGGFGRQIYHCDYIGYTNNPRVIKVYGRRLEKGLCDKFDPNRTKRPVNWSLLRKKIENSYYV